MKGKLADPGPGAALGSDPGPAWGPPELFVMLRRVDPAQNVARFYLVQVGPSLLEEVAVIRFWGRIGGSQRIMVTNCPDQASAHKLAERLVKLRLKHGYQIIAREEAP